MQSETQHEVFPDAVFFPDRRGGLPVLRKTSLKGHPQPPFRKDYVMNRKALRMIATCIVLAAQGAALASSSAAAYGLGADTNFGAQPAPRTGYGLIVSIAVAATLAPTLAIAGTSV
jgi:hypothetical protein